MELLRRALLVGCILPGLWLLRLAPLEPLLTVVHVDFAARQRQEAASVPEGRRTEGQQRRALLPLSVYVEEVLQYNVFPAVGPEWDRFLRAVDERRRGADEPLLFFRADEDPLSAVLDKLAAGEGTTFVSISRPGGDLHYQVERRTFSRRDFRPGAGFTGQPAPPASLLYPFRAVGLGAIAAGIAFFALLPSPRRSGAEGAPVIVDLAALGAGLLAFAIPLVGVGGSVQALTRGLWLTLPCWMLAAVGVHVFARPARNAPDPVILSVGRPSSRTLFLREGVAFLAMAVGPLAFLISASMILWNR